MKKKTSETESFFKEECEVLLKKNTELEKYSIGSTLIACILLLSSIWLSVGNRDLTAYVRRDRQYHDRMWAGRIFKIACKEIDGVPAFDTCYVGNARLTTLEEIKQAKLHFDLGAKK
jgi:hypothetical protein